MTPQRLAPVAASTPSPAHPPATWPRLIGRGFFWFLFFTSQLVALALISWHLVAQFHFAYPTGYRLLGLDQTIAQYAPLNKHKRDFEFTTSAEHWRLFGEISDAVQSSGQGLAQIRYALPDGSTTPLMHEAEIVHLQDVADLIDRFYAVGAACALLWLGLFTAAYLRQYALPPLSKIGLGLLAGLGTATLAVLAIGPAAVFYWLHVQVFPEGHQWFFYYQDSLMTTLMKAPDIFAFITVLLLAVWVALGAASLYGLHRVLRGPAAAAAPAPPPPSAPPRPRRAAQPGRKTGA